MFCPLIKCLFCEAKRSKITGSRNQMNGRYRIAYLDTQWQFLFSARTKTVFFANIFACPVKCGAYFSGVRLKF